MKIFTGALKPLVVLAGWAVLAASGSLVWKAAPTVPPRLVRLQEREREREEAERRPDRPDLVQQQEVALTRDPQTGTVPRERLLVAKAQIEQLLLARASQRPAASSLSNANWTEKGPNNIGGRLRALLPDPADATGNIVWAGSVGGGLWKTTNAASAAPTWTQVNDAFGSLAVTALAADPESPDIMYFGTGEGFYNMDAVQGLGIWKSVNHGVSWTHLAATNNSNFYYVQRLTVAPNGHLYAATRSGLWRSTNKGVAWTQVLGTGNGSVVNDFGDVKAAANGTLYAAAGLVFSPNDGIYRSTNNGNSWTRLNTLPGSGLPTSGFERIELACAPSDANRVYAIFQSSSTRGLLDIYRSTNGGNSWQALPKPDDADPDITAADFTRGQGWYDLLLTVSPTDPNTVFVGGVDLFKTSNAGATDAATVSWRQLSHWYAGYGFQFVHADHHTMVFAPGSGTRAYFGNDGGFATTSNATAVTPTITHRNSGLNVTQFFSVAMHPTNVNYFLAGAQDNGTQQLGPLGGLASRDINGGDGAFCFIDEDEPQFQFATYVRSNIYRSSTGGNDVTNGYFFPETISQDNGGSFINPMEYDSKFNVLYFAYGNNQLRRCIRATGPIGNATLGPALSTIALPAGSGVVTHVCMSPNVDNRVYVGTDAGRVIRIDNATGASPTVSTLYSDAFSVSVSCVAVERGTATPNPDQHLLLTLANYGAAVVNVRQSVNGGSTWTAAEGNIPDMPVRWAMFDPAGGTRAMLATELGTWTTDDLAATPVVWAPANTNLANVRVDMLRLRKVDKSVVAATHGRGLFTSNIFAIAPLPVQLVAFTGRATEQGVALSWRTASELNASSFEVERSANGRDFGRLASVKAAGTSTTTRSYAYTDGTAGPGRHSYRLHQLDLDGTAAYSPVVTVEIKEAPAPLFSSAYPNPFDQKLTLQLPQPIGAGFTATLTDARGRTAFSTALRGEGRQLPLAVPARLASGTYLLTVRGAGRQTTQRVQRR
ncbi:Por secretion system C-terminal sorting domain-containing protein [Hymenobacter daecheongensis DSM 21074]|uniref:Por secretion system C-terminal sorting domain-containing protein n=1 Tax=Hymenobacter daecheongensis DSM 21074 TaxID=1121955 RepID=A0A1M6INE6_9BACT|nr:hypothetical protein [Hymenobacter daecheongensis]SHJ36004.1 Por secretion system C-terminal sorting domain-containing protein [Hymenobacter daecheongensis DSM 21074]